MYIFITEMLESIYKQYSVLSEFTVLRSISAPPQRVGAVKNKKKKEKKYTKHFWHIYLFIYLNVLIVCFFCGLIVFGFNPCIMLNNKNKKSVQSLLCGSN